jgi:hypothetical protein
VNEKGSPHAPQLHRQVFIVRVWVETGSSVEDAPFWRGSIEHVGSEEKRVYFQCFDEIEPVILSHLGKMGIRPNLLKRIRRCFKIIFPGVING